MRGGLVELRISSNGLGEVVRCGRCEKTFASQEEALDHIETLALEKGDDGHFILNLVRVEDEAKEE